MLRRLIMATIILAPFASARAATLAGVEMPDVQIVEGTPLRLNGIGLRAYSVFKIRIYVAGLYLEHRSDNAEAILHSPEKKLLDIHFLHDVDEDEARRAWRNGFSNNCVPPACYIDPKDVERFVSQVPEIHKGDRTRMVFTPSGAQVTINGKALGAIKDTHLAEVLLSTFLGPAPPTKALKQELLGIAD